MDYLTSIVVEVALKGGGEALKEVFKVHTDQDLKSEPSMKSIVLH